MDQFVEPLRITCTLKVKANSVKQEYEKQDELKRSALRALAALVSITKAGKHPNTTKLFDILTFCAFLQDKNQQMADFLKYIKETPDLLSIFTMVQKDSTIVNNSLDSASMDQS